MFYTRTLKADDMPLLLPPDPDDMNQKRALAAKRALLYFARDFGETDDHGELAEFGEQNLSDLLVDLAHYCDREHLSFLKCFLRASGSYADETESLGTQFKARITA
jgi:hypothetical protein